MNSFFKSNMYLADSDSTNFDNTDGQRYINKFKSALLFADSIGVNPNMMIDSKHFESVLTDQSVKNFFQLQYKHEKRKIINIHIFNDFIEDDFFDMKLRQKDNPFLEYFHKKINDEYFFSSVQLTKSQLLQDMKYKEEIENRLNRLYEIAKTFYDCYGENIFEIKKQYEEADSYRNSVIKNATQMISQLKEKAIGNTTSVKYLLAINHFLGEIEEKNNVLNRSHFYSLIDNSNAMKHIVENDLKILSSLKYELIDATYNYRFIGKDELFRFRSNDTLDLYLTKAFDLYSNNHEIQNAYDIYKTLDNIKSKFEIISLIWDPSKIINFVVNELVNKGQEKSMSLSRMVISKGIPKFGLLGISNIKNMAIGIK